MYAFLVDAFSVGHFKQGQQYVAGRLSGARSTCYSKVITATSDLNTQALFYLPQMFIKLTAEIGKAVVIGGLEHNVSRYLNSVQKVY
ncbi:MAG: hypothetical protein WBN09_14240 [Woeseiaceae bacterium]